MRRFQREIPQSASRFTMPGTSLVSNLRPPLISSSPKSRIRAPDLGSFLPLHLLIQSTADWLSPMRRTGPRVFVGFASFATTTVKAEITILGTRVLKRIMKYARKKTVQIQPQKLAHTLFGPVFFLFWGGDVNPTILVNIFGGCRFRLFIFSRTPLHS